MFKEFKEFAVKGNALDLAVGVIIGAAFGQMVNSIVKDLFNPILGLIVGQVDFQSVAINLPGDRILGIGVFLNAVINFVMVSFVIFLLVKQMNRFRRKPVPAEPNTKPCPFCFTNISKKATRCSACTSQLDS
jgi:large conductance mechanosensitive channel